MNTKQEILDALNRENDGSAPPALFTQTGTVQQMEACRIFWPEANYNIDMMIELALQPSRLYGFATVRIPYDMTSQAERLGCDIQRGTRGTQPAVTSSPWMLDGMLVLPEDLMSVEEFLSGGRVAMHIEAANRISKEHPDLFLTSCMTGPQTVAAYLVGMENFLMGMFMDPDGMVKCIDIVAPYQYAYGHELSVASDNVMVITEGSSEIMPADMLDIYTTPYETKLFKSIDESFSLLHSCGDTSESLDTLLGLGANILSVESHGDPQNIVDRVGGKMLIAGGVDPVRVLLQGTPDTVKESAHSADEAGYDIIMSECGVPPMTKGENLLALSNYRDS